MAIARTGDFLENPTEIHASPQDWETLMRTSHSLISHINLRQLPLIKRNLNQIEEASRRLEHSHSRPLSDIIGQRFLVERGFDASFHSSLIESLNLTSISTFPKILDVEAYLLQQHSKNISDTISAANSFTSFQYYVDHIISDWEKVKMDSLEYYGAYKIESLSDYNKIDDVIERDIPKFDIKCEYDNGILELLSARKSNIPINIIYEFKKVILRNEIIECWDLLSNMIHGNENNEIKILHEGEYKGIHTSGSLKTSISSTLINGAINYSEKIFRRFMTAEVEKNQMDIERGGVPGLLSDISAYVKILLRDNINLNRDLIGIDSTNSKIWMEIFYCLRCGNPSAALILLKPYESLHSYENIYYAIENLNKKFMPFDSNRLSSLVHQYKNEISGCTDPFKVAVFAILSYSDFNFNNKEHWSIIAPTFEDWIWLHLKRLWLYNSPIPSWLSESLSLSKLQEKIINIHSFSKKESYFNKFRLYSMCLLFEEGIALLSKSEHFVHGLHFGIALDHYGLISNRNDIIDLNHMIIKYSESIASRSLSIASHYILLLLKNKKEEEILKYLIMYLDYDRIEDSLINLVSDKHLSPLLSLLSEELINNNDLVNGVKIHLLLNNVNYIIDILIVSLCRLLSKINDPQRSLLISLINKNWDKIASSQLSVLLLLASFYDAYREEKYDNALDIIDKLTLIPLDNSEDSLKRSHSNYRILHVTIQNAIPEIIHTIMKIYCSKFNSAKAEAASNVTIKQVILKTLYSKSIALVNFATLINCPSDIVKELIRMESIISSG